MKENTKSSTIKNVKIKIDKERKPIIYKSFEELNKAFKEKHLC